MRCWGRGLLEDGPVGLDGGDGRVLGVGVPSVRVQHLGPVDHQAYGGGARARRGAGGDADNLPIGSPGGKGEEKGI